MPYSDSTTTEADERWARKISSPQTASTARSCWAMAAPDRWFTYYYWLDDTLAPDYARTVDIHRKPGYDPVELFLDPTLRAPKLKIGATLLKKALGFRYLMDVIPLDATLVRGSHGRVFDDHRRPVFITSDPALVDSEVVDATAVKQLILDHVFSP